MSDLIEAIVAKIKADATCASLLTGGVYVDLGRQGALTAGPMVVITEVGGSPRWTAGGGSERATRIDDLTIQASCYATSRATAKTCGNAVAAALNDASLTFTEGTLCYIRQTNRYANRDMDLGPGGATVWAEHREIRAITSQEL